MQRATSPLSAANRSTSSDLATGPSHLPVVGALCSRRADTREPINPLELAKLETSKDQVADQIQAFDRYNLALNSRKK